MTVHMTKADDDYGETAWCGIRQPYVFKPEHDLEDESHLAKVDCEACLIAVMDLGERCANRLRAVREDRERRERQVKP